MTQIREMTLADLRVAKDYAAEQVTRTGGVERYRWEDFRDALMTEIDKRVRQIMLINITTH